MATGEGYGPCSYCGRDSAWHGADTRSGEIEECCDCGFSRLEAPDRSVFRFKRWGIEVRESKGKLLLDGEELGGETGIAELLEFLLRVVPGNVVTAHQVEELRKKYLDDTGFLPGL
jgi:hypothetical protein